MRSAGVPARHRRWGGDDPTCIASSSPGHRFRSRRSSALSGRPAGDMGPAAGPRSVQARSDRRRSRRRRSTPGPGSAGRRRGARDRLRHRDLDAGDGRRPSRISTWSRSRCTGAGLAQLLSAIDRDGRHQHPPDPRRRRRRARAHVRAGFADRGAGVLPRPVAEGPPSQAPAAATGDTVALIADRLRPGGILHAATDHAGYAEQIAEVGDAEPRLTPGHRRRAACRSRCGGRSPSTRARPSDAGSAVTELLWEKRDA